jgi:cytoskeletal protein CcmA (bactofilin family)
MALLSRLIPGAAKTSVSLPLPTAVQASAPPRHHSDTGSIALRAFSRTAGAFTLGTDVCIKAAERIVCKTAMIEGALDATLETASLNIARSGSMRGRVQAHHAEIRGEFEGELIVHGKLVVYAGARITGKVRFAEIVLWKGGVVSGNVKRLPNAQSPRSPARKHRPELVSESRLMGADENPVTLSTYSL